MQFEINPETGEFSPTGQGTPSITPVTIVFKSPSRAAPLAKQEELGQGIGPSIRPS